MQVALAPELRGAMAPGRPSRPTSLVITNAVRFRPCIDIHKVR